MFNLIGTLQARVERMRSKKHRKAGLTLIEVATVVAISALLNAPQFANSLVMIQSGTGGSSVENMKTLAAKISVYCQNAGRACGGLASGTLAIGGTTLPTDYIATYPVEPGTGASYTITVLNDASGAFCFSLEGTATYPENSLANFTGVDGKKLSPVGQTPLYLHYDSLTGTVYAMTTNTPPLVNCSTPP
jgi:hypothetical protein